MIKYALHCAHGHAFEGWFGNSEDFSKQSDRGLLACPVCGDATVEKALMAPAVSTSRRKAVRTEAAPASTEVATIDPQRQEIITQVRALRERLLEGAENVGPRFGEEARKIHYGETDQRQIYGQASPKEAAELIEEGIGVLPLPVLPEDRN